MLDTKPKTIDETEKVKKKLLSYAKNLGTFCDKLNLDWIISSEKNTGFYMKKLYDLHFFYF